MRRWSKRPRAEGGTLRTRDKLEWWQNTASAFAREIGIEPPALTIRGTTTRLRTGVLNPRALTVDAHTLNEHTSTNAGRWVAARAMVMASASARRGDTLTAQVLLPISLVLALSLLYTVIGNGFDSTALALTVGLLVMLALSTAVAIPAFARLRAANRAADTHATILAGRDAAADYLKSGGDLHRTALHRILAGEDTTAVRMGNLAITQTPAPAGNDG